jgi:hypothetical protein
MSDRTVHGRYGRSEIVRYDRSGAWYIEHKEGGRAGTRKRLTVREAADWIITTDSWNRGLAGGAVFDRLVAERLGR